VKLFADLQTPVITLPAYYEELTQHQRRMVREEYVRRQKGLCMHCYEPLGKEPAEFVRTRWIDLSLFPPGFLDHPIHLHHSHETGKTIGALHARCNAYLFQYKGE
jgi:hypothetical protein